MVVSPEVERRYRGVFDSSYRPVLAYVLRRAPDRAMAEDVVAETFLIAWRRLDEVPLGIETQPWLFGVARRVMANSRRGDARRDRLLGRLRQHRPIPTSAVEERATELAGGSAVVVAMARLRPAEAEVLRLVAWDDLSHAQIAVLLGCSVNAVAIRVHRARASLRAELEKGGLQTGQQPLAVRRSN